MKRILTACQATSDQLHIGNYFWAIKPLIDQMQDPNNDFWLFVVDLHSITKVMALRETPDYHRWTYNLVKLYMACGVDMTKTTIFKQSDVPAHVQLHWILSCFTHVGFMQRMHVYKDALAKNEVTSMSIGTMNYPILMAADILLYDVDVVPVGKDNQQHVEYCADVAAKINARYGDIFKIPEFAVSHEIGQIPGLDGRKMSKSYNNFIWLLDSPEVLRKKINKIVSGDEWPTDPKDPETSTLYSLCALFLDDAGKLELATKFREGNISYKETKDVLYELVVNFLVPIQERFAQISDDEVTNLLSTNATKANIIASAKIDLIYKKIGFRV